MDAEAEGEWFDDVYRLHWVGMVRLAFALVDDRQAAQDVAQEAFAKVFRARDRVQDPLPYLRSAVYNVSRNHLRDAGRRRRRESGESTDLVQPEGDHVIDVVRRLPDRPRALVILRYYEGLTDSEIAAATGLPLGTVKSTLHRTLNALREELS